MPRKWIQVQVEVRPALADAVSNFLIELGSPGVAQDRARGGRRERITAYFPGGRSLIRYEKKIRTYLAALLPSPDRYGLRLRVIPEEKWAEAWKSNFKPVHVTRHLVVKPPWEKYARKKGEVVIQIDPGMAFGTGAHPSTKMCLQVFEEMVPSLPSPPAVLDVGTGSGILAIAAWKFGAREVVAIDIDPVAVDCARKNAALNGAGKAIEFRVGSPESLRRKFNLVAANLLPQEISALASSLTARVKPEGFLIVSGILAGQKEETASELEGKGFVLRKARELKGWAALVLAREGKTGRCGKEAPGRKK